MQTHLGQSKFQIFCYLFFLVILNNWFIQPSPAWCGHQYSMLFSSLPPEQSLVQNSVRAIVQDHDGFLWIGTLGGLHRFDGQNMVLVNDLEDMDSSLDLVQVECLAVDKQGDIWVAGVFGELNQIHTSDGSIESYSDLTQSTITNSNKTIYRIIPDDNGFIWINSYSGIFRMNPHTRTMTRLNPIFPETWGNSEIILSTPLNNGLHLVTNQFSVGLYNENDNTIVHLSLADGSSLKNVIISHSLQLADGSLWALGDPSFVAEIILDGDQSHLVLYPMPGESVFQGMISGKPGERWLRSREGDLFLSTPESKAFSLQELAFNGRMYQERYWLHCMFYDRSGITWVGTEGYGVGFHDPSSTRFRSISGRTSQPDGLKNPYIWDLKNTENGTLIGARFELGFMDSQTHTYQRLLDMDNFSVFNKCEDMFCFFPLDTNRILMGFQYFSPGVFDFRDSSYTQLKEANSTITLTQRLKSVKAIIEGNNQNLWVLGSFGCVHLDRTTLKPIPLPLLLDQKLQGIHLRTMIEQNNGVLWFGSEHNGLIRYHPDTNELTNWMPSHLPNQLPHEGIRSLYLDPDGNLWIGTYQGLALLKKTVLDAGKMELETFTTVNGLPNNTVYDILPGENKMLWLSTNLGLSHFNTQNKTFLNYNLNDGLANNEFNGGAAIKDSHGWVYFGGINGLTWFQPQKKYQNTTVPLVAITQLRIGNNEPCPLLTPPGLETITIPWNNNILEVSLAALCFQQPDKQKVAYRIPEIDEKWWEAPRDQVIRITNIPAGEFHFEYKASNNDGLWSKTRSLNLHVESTPWSSPRAFALYALIAILITLIMRRRYTKQKAQENETRQQLALADKLNAVGQLAAGMAHDFNNQLQIIMGNAEILKYELDATHPGHRPLDVISRTGRRAGFLTSRLLAYAKDTDPVREPLDLDELISSMTDLLVSFLGARITLKTKHQTGQKVILANQEQLEHVLMNLCLNSKDAIKGQGIIEINTTKFKADNGDIHCTLEIKDSGQGISDDDKRRIFDPFFTTKPDGKGSGLGLSMVSQIIKRHDGKIDVSNNEMGGTTFLVTLPSGSPQVKTSLIVPEFSKEKNKTNSTVLVADDELAVNQLSSKILTRAGFTVISVLNGEKAIEALDQHPEISLAVLDVVMPVMDGRAVYDHIQKTGLNIPVLFCSGFSFSALKENEFKEIDVPVLAKPFTTDELLEAITLLQNITKT